MLYKFYGINIFLISATKKNMTTNLIQGLDNKVTENQIELKKINFNLTKLKNKLIEKNLVPRPKDKKDVEKEIINGMLYI